MTFEEQETFIKSLGLSKSKEQGIWFNNKYIVSIGCINDAIIITKIKEK
jgi:hypothetical protein